MKKVFRGKINMRIAAIITAVVLASCLLVQVSFAEKADKQIMAMSQALLSNKNLANKVKTEHPEIYQKIQSIFNKEKDLYRDQ